jgi:hypothetical protein
MIESTTFKIWLLLEMAGTCDVHARTGHYCPPDWLLAVFVMYVLASSDQADQILSRMDERERRGYRHGAAGQYERYEKPHRSNVGTQNENPNSYGTRNASCKREGNYHPYARCLSRLERITLTVRLSRAIDKPVPRFWRTLRHWCPQIGVGSPVWRVLANFGPGRGVNCHQDSATHHTVGEGSLLENSKLSRYMEVRGTLAAVYIFRRDCSDILQGFPCDHRDVSNISVESWQPRRRSEVSAELGMLAYSICRA